MAAQSAAVGAAFPEESFTAGAPGFGDDDDRGAPGCSFEEIGSSYG